MSPRWCVAVVADEFALTDQPGALPPAAERGTLEVRTRALQHLAEHAATQVRGTVAHTSRIGALGRGYPRADVSVESSRAWITVDVAATWPCRVTALAAEVRGSVRSETIRTTGTDVCTVDVTVHVVDADDDQQSRRVQ